MENRIKLNDGTITLTGFEEIKNFPFIRFSFPGEQSFYISGCDDDSEKTERHYSIAYEKVADDIVINSKDLAKKLAERNATDKIFSYHNNAYFAM